MKVVKLPENVAKVLGAVEHGKYKADFKEMVYSWKRFLDKEQVTKIVTSVINEAYKTN